MFPNTPWGNIKPLLSVDNNETILWLRGICKRLSEQRWTYNSPCIMNYSVFEASVSINVGETLCIFKTTEHCDQLRNSAESSTAYGWTSLKNSSNYHNLQDAYIRPVVYANMSFIKNTTSFILSKVWEMSPSLATSSCAS